MNTALPILAWARTPVAPRGGALRLRHPHQLAAPLIEALLARAGLPGSAIDGLILGNALGAGGNPARLAALAAGLPESCPAISLDSQCCAGLDAVQMAAARIASGQADVLIAGGAEAWSRAPIRAHRPLPTGTGGAATGLTTEIPHTYERPAFSPWPERDPDPIEAAACYAGQQAWLRRQQDDYARDSHERAVQAQDELLEAIVPVDGLDHDSYPRRLPPGRLARLPTIAAARSAQGQDCSLSTLSISPQADGAALVLLASPAACRRHGLRPHAWYAGGLSIGTAPEHPMLGAARAALGALHRRGWRSGWLDAVELHDAFAVQGLAFQRALALPPALLNANGGGLARGHPIGASGAIALVQLLATLDRRGSGARRRRGLAAIAAAGGLGSAVLVEVSGAGVPSGPSPAQG